MKAYLNEQVMHFVVPNWIQSLFHNSRVVLLLWPSPQFNRWIAKTVYVSCWQTACFNDFDSQQANMSQLQIFNRAGNRLVLSVRDQLGCRGV